MEYNTCRNKLVLPEYGRNVQKMVEYAMTIENRDDRNKEVKNIIGIMGNMNPHLRDISDFKHKLWDHLMIMARFELDIDSPYPLIKEEALHSKPSHIPYKNNEITYRHFGRTIELLIDKASEMEESRQKEDLIEIIANHMKKSYLMWNKEIVSDETIFKAIDRISKGKLSVSDTLKLTDSKEILMRNKRKRTRKDNDRKR